MRKKKTNIAKEYKSLTKKVDDLIENVEADSLSKADKKEILAEIEEAMKLIHSTQVVSEE